MGWTIRSAALGDLAVIARFNSLLAWETEHKRLDPETIERGVRRALAAPELCRYFVAEQAGQIVGQAMITIELTDWRDGLLWWLQSVYVAESHRGQGVFKALFQHIRALAEADGQVRGLRLYVERDNERAQRVYQQLGMQPSGHLVFEHPVFERDWSGLG